MSDTALTAAAITIELSDIEARVTTTEVLQVVMSCETRLTALMSAAGPLIQSDDTLRSRARTVMQAVLVALRTLNTGETTFTSRRVPPATPPTITLPFKLVLGWFMASDPTPLSTADDEALRKMLNARAQELDLTDWVEAFHTL